MPSWASCGTVTRCDIGNVLLRVVEEERADHIAEWVRLTEDGVSAHYEQKPQEDGQRVVLAAPSASLASIVMKPKFPRCRSDSSFMAVTTTIGKLTLNRDILSLVKLRFSQPNAPGDMVG